MRLNSVATGPVRVNVMEILKGKVEFADLRRSAREIPNDNDEISHPEFTGLRSMVRRQ